MRTRWLARRRHSRRCLEPGDGSDEADAREHQANGYKPAHLRDVIAATGLSVQVRKGAAVTAEGSVASATAMAAFSRASDAYGGRRIWNPYVGR